MGKRGHCFWILQFISYINLIIISKEINRRKKSAEGGNGESLEQYKSENQTLLLQVSISPASLTRLS